MEQAKDEMTSLRNRVKFLTSEIQRLQRNVNTSPDTKEVRAKVWEQAANDYLIAWHTNSFSAYCLAKAAAIREGKE